MKTPKNWRKGQTIFNFLEWLRIEKKYTAEQSARMADPFYLTDEDYDKLMNEFLAFYIKEE